MDTGSSRRRFFRKPTQIPVVVRKAVSKSGETRDLSAERFMAQDLSAGGIGLVGQISIEIGTLLDLEFTVKREDEDVEFKVQAVVRGCRPFGRKPLPLVVGAEFVLLSPDQAALLRGFSTVSFLV